MRIVFFTLLIAFVVLRENAAHYYNHPHHDVFYNELVNTFERYKRELKALFDTLQSSVHGNYNKHEVEESLSASKLCIKQIANATLYSERMENSMKPNIDQLHKKLQDTVDQLLHINKTCKCRTAAIENFQKIGNKFYRFENKLKLNWFAAYKRCQKLGAHLSSLQEEDELEKLRGNLTGTDYWLGINDLAIPDEYRISTTDQRATILIWDAGQPQNDDGESIASNCSKMVPTTQWARGHAGCNSTSSARKSSLKSPNEGRCAKRGEEFC